VDAVFASLRENPGFVALTNGADGKLKPPQEQTMSGAGTAN
jgi:hypothetical protein